MKEIWASGNKKTLTLESAKKNWRYVNSATCFVTADPGIIASTSAMLIRLSCILSFSGVTINIFMTVRMEQEKLELYTGHLICNSGFATEIGLSAMLEGEMSHAIDPLFISEGIHTPPKTSRGFIHTQSVCLIQAIFAHPLKYAELCIFEGMGKNSHTVINL